VFDAKRLIGRRMDDEDIKKDMKHWPFKVTDKSGKPYITVKHKGLDRDFVRNALSQFSQFSYTTIESRRNQRYGLDQDEGNRRGIPGSEGHPRRCHRTSM
jgi:molecular chaperone DnaK (HSP70)